MPTYEYACGACGHEWEQTQRITEAPVEACPKCGQPKAHRLISGGTNFILKGGGWYSDLYASPKGPAKKADEAGAPGAGEAAKPAATSHSGDAKPSESKSDASPSPAKPAAPTTPASS